MATAILTPAIRSTSTSACDAAGTSYYALDVSDPENPKLLWRIDKGGQFAELGQTWSTPRIGRMLYGGSTTPRPVVIFAGGYDTNKDNVLGSTVIGTNDSMGNAIFVVNAETGRLSGRQ